MDGRIVVTRPEEGDFKAFPAIRTHQDRAVADVADGTAGRARHGGRCRNTDGSVERGPRPGRCPRQRITAEGNPVHRA
ncbi:hypothetical protein [Streptomyces pimonensis]|uniref:hypothetical protein n=1 Tax=Streptomyces pimonensis TaxID=2860288 RepID=UPI003528547D